MLGDRAPFVTTRCNRPSLRHPVPRGLSQRAIETDFSGGVITSNGGVTLLRRADEQLDLTRPLAACFADCRRPELVVHDVESLVVQRLYGLALGYEDLNDHEDPRRDPALQAVIAKNGRDKRPPLFMLKSVTDWV